MKAQEFRDLSPVDINGKIEDMAEELFNLRFQARLGSLSNPLRISEVKRDIARAKTVLAQKKIVSSK